MNAPEYNATQAILGIREINSKWYEFHNNGQYTIQKKNGDYDSEPIGNYESTGTYHCVSDENGFIELITRPTIFEEPMFILACLMPKSVIDQDNIIPL